MVQILECISCLCFSSKILEKYLLMQVDHLQILKWLYPSLCLSQRNPFQAASLTRGDVPQTFSRSELDIELQTYGFLWEDWNRQKMSIVSNNDKLSPLYDLSMVAQWGRWQYQVLWIVINLCLWLLGFGNLRPSAHREMGKVGQSPEAEAGLQDSSVENFPN